MYHWYTLKYYKDAIWISVIKNNNMNYKGWTNWKSIFDIKNCCHQTTYWGISLNLGDQSYPANHIQILFLTLWNNLQQNTNLSLSSTNKQNLPLICIYRHSQSISNIKNCCHQKTDWGIHLNLGEPTYILEIGQNLLNSYICM